ncbi:DUF3570 domain-containing protein [Aureibaculum luteum]|uniref:DUF3570 domain-containing protein n=1 Tax=Aureibaculum luteum TaxID=1548456 RepID=UPI000E54CB09|nr:DUF3570 domain-containing protein [Aureibaculum luteum]
MKKLVLVVVSCFASFLVFAQEKTPETSYKKRVLENVEVDILSSYYSQDGDNAAVTGGIGTEELTDFTPTITISIPLNDDDVLIIDAGISAYTSASSSNLDPFDSSGASQGGDDDDDDDDDDFPTEANGSPWVASSGASQKDTWINVNASYSHSSDDRNKIWGANVSLAKEYDYTSIGFGGSYALLFNEKNTEISIKANAFFDKWKPVYPTEIDSYNEANQNLNSGFFSNIDILDQSGDIIDKNSTNSWSAFNTTLVDDDKRNTYSLSLSFSQILSKNAQLSLFVDVVKQEGWLSNPMQRVYFGDRANYYIGNANSIDNYTSKSNKDVFQLADDIERLPNSRFKTPIGMRFNYYLNEFLTVRTYYRYYSDDWGVSSHTASIELPIKIGDKFTLYPAYRFYNQTAADYFAPYEEHFSTQAYYTSDYDLSEFNANQYSFGIKYTDIFTKLKIQKFGLKTIDLRYSYYERNTGLQSGIISAGFKFVMD